MMVHETKEEHRKYKVDFIRRDGALDVEYVFAESENSAWDVPLETEEHEAVERVNVVVVSGI